MDIKRLFETLDTYYHYDMQDYEVGPDEIESLFHTAPENIIEMLLDVIDDLED